MVVKKEHLSLLSHRTLRSLHHKFFDSSDDERSSSDIDDNDSEDFSQPEEEYLKDLALSELTLDLLTVDDLKEICGAAEKPVSGRKAELARRLGYDIATAKKVTAEPCMRNDAKPSRKTKQ